MNKKISLLGIGVFLPLFSFCQFWEFGVMGGVSNYMGDLSPTPVVIAETHAATGILIRANFTRYFTLKTNCYYGTISGDDRNASSDPIKLNRNLSFVSNILDVGANAEYNFSGYQANKNKYKASPYAFIGLSMFHFNPKATLPGGTELIALQPQGTEGQGTTLYNDREKYSLTEISVPFGVGAKVNFAHFMGFGVEAGLRKTFTDYLDDVSKTYVEKDILDRERTDNYAFLLSNKTGDPTLASETMRGNPKTKDWYMFAGATLTFTILPPYCYKFR